MLKYTVLMIVETKSGSGFTGRKVKGTIHWVDAINAVPAEFRLYEPLILDEDTRRRKNFLKSNKSKFYGSFTRLYRTKYEGFKTTR